MRQLNLLDCCGTVGAAAFFVAAALGVAAPFTSRSLSPLAQSVLRGGQCTSTANQTCGQPQQNNCLSGQFECAQGGCNKNLVGQPCGTQVDGYSPNQCIGSNGGGCAKGQQTPCQDTISCKCGNYGTDTQPDYQCANASKTTNNTYYCLSY